MVDFKAMLAASRARKTASHTGEDRPPSRIMREERAVSRSTFGELAMINADDDTSLDVLELDESLSEVEKPPEVSAGSYTAEVQDVQKKTSDKGNDYYAVKFVIPQKNLPPDVAEHYEDGATLYWNRQIVPGKGDRRALFSLRKFMEALGLDSNTTTVDPNEWMGRSARLVVQMNKYKGELRAEIKSVEQAEAAKPKAATTRRGK